MILMLNLQVEEGKMMSDQDFRERVLHAVEDLKRTHERSIEEVKQSIEEVKRTNERSIEEVKQSIEEVKRTNERSFEEVKYLSLIHI